MYQPAGPAPSHSSVLISPGVPVYCAEVQNAPASPLPRILPLQGCRGWVPALSSPRGRGRLGSSPRRDASGSLALASRPFKPVFMSLSGLHGRPRCQASFTQLPSSQDTMLSSESLHWAQIETLSWQGFRAKSSFDTVRTSLPSWHCMLEGKELTSAESRN